MQHKLRWTNIKKRMTYLAHLVFSTLKVKYLIAMLLLRMMTSHLLAILNNLIISFFRRLAVKGPICSKSCQNIEINVKILFNGKVPCLCW